MQTDLCGVFFSVFWFYEKYTGNKGFSGNFLKWKKSCSSCRQCYNTRTLIMTFEMKDQIILHSYVFCTFQIWCLTAGKLLTDFNMHIAGVNVVEFHPSDLLLASGSSDRWVVFSCRYTPALCDKGEGYACDTRQQVCCSNLCHEIPLS